MADDIASKESPATNEETPKAEIKGQVVFEHKCALCHGNDGTDGIGNAANLQRSKMEKVLVYKIIVVQLKYSDSCLMRPHRQSPLQRRGAIESLITKGLTRFDIFYPIIMI